MLNVSPLLQPIYRFNLHLPCSLFLLQRKSLLAIISTDQNFLQTWLATFFFSVSFWPALCMQTKQKQCCLLFFDDRDNSKDKTRNLSSFVKYEVKSIWSWPFQTPDSLGGKKGWKNAEWADIPLSVLQFPSGELIQSQISGVAIFFFNCEAYLKGEESRISAVWKSFLKSYYFDFQFSLHAHSSSSR